MPVITDTSPTERHFALESQKSEVLCNRILNGWQDTLRLCEKTLEPSGSSVGCTAAAAPEDGTASSSTSSGPSRQLRRRPPTPRRPYGPYLVTERRQRTRRTLEPPVPESPESTRSRSEILSAAGVSGDYQFTAQEATCISNTPDIPWKTFTSLFGGIFHAERPVCRKVPGYENFLRTNDVTQPHAPTRPGEPGLILSSPGVPLLDIFHVLISQTVRGKKTALKYCGIYSKVQSTEVQVDEWHGLSKMCRITWLTRVRQMTVGDVHARCSLRMRRGSAADPSPAEIREWLQRYDQDSETLERTRRVFQNSFDSGAEKFSFEVIKCVGYDTQMAELIQQESTADVMSVSD